MPIKIKQFNVFFSWTVVPLYTRHLMPMTNAELRARAPVQSPRLVFFKVCAKPEPETAGNYISWQERPSLGREDVASP